MTKLFSCDYDHYDNAKCRRNVNFEEMDTELSTGESNRFSLLGEIVMNYIKQNIIMAVLRKANSHSVVIFRFSISFHLYKTKINNKKNNLSKKYIM